MDQPKISWHPASKRAYITYQKKRYYLGHWADKSLPIPKEVKLKYHTVVGQLWHLGKTEEAPPPEWSIGEMCAEYLVAVNGKLHPASYTAAALAAQKLCLLFGTTEAKTFTAGKLRKVQEHYIEKKLSRGYINSQIAWIYRIFKWAVSFDRIPAAVLVAIKTVPGIPSGTKGVREAPGVNMVPLDVVKKTLPHLFEPVRSMVKIQLMTGARPGEVRGMTWGAIDRSDKSMWIYSPKEHKTARLGKVRSIPLGPEAQAVLMLFPRLDPDAPIFDPGIATRGGPKGPPRKYNRMSYPYAIRRVCEKNKIPVWNPRQLRKLAAQRVDDILGIEHASALLGHGGIGITRRVYARSQLEKAKAATLKIEKIS